MEQGGGRLELMTCNYLLRHIQLKTNSVLHKYNSRDYLYSGRTAKLNRRVPNIDRDVTNRLFNCSLVQVEMDLDKSVVSIVYQLPYRTQVKRDNTLSTLGGMPTSCRRVAFAAT